MAIMVKCQLAKQPNSQEDILDQLHEGKRFCIGLLGFTRLVRKQIFKVATVQLIYLAMCRKSMYIMHNDITVQ